MASAAAVATLAGCDQYDPLYREGLWRPNHSNRTDTVVQAAYPADLVHGTGSRTTDGVLAADAIQRLHDDKVKKLPTAGLSDVNVKGQGSD